MVKNNTIDSDNRKLMKSFFSVKEMLQELRENSSPEAFATLSIEEVYNIAIEVIDLIRFIRREQELVRKRATLNRGMLEVDPSFANVGGLIPITVRFNPFILYSEEERSNLNSMQEVLIHWKRALVNMEIPSEKSVIAKANERFKSLGIPRTQRLNRKNLKKHNAYYAQKRRKRK